MSDEIHTRLCMRVLVFIDSKYSCSPFKLWVPNKLQIALWITSILKKWDSNCHTTSVLNHSKFTKKLLICVYPMALLNNICFYVLHNFKTCAPVLVHMCANDNIGNITKSGVLKLFTYICVPQQMQHQNIMLMQQPSHGLTRRLFAVQRDERKYMKKFLGDEG